MINARRLMRKLQNLDSVKRQFIALIIDDPSGKMVMILNFDNRTPSTSQGESERFKGALKALDFLYPSNDNSKSLKI